MEGRDKQWKKYIVQLEDVDAYDFGSIPDEAHRVKSMDKNETTGHKSCTLKQVMLEVEHIIQRETDRKASWKDRNTVRSRKVAGKDKGSGAQERRRGVRFKDCAPLTANASLRRGSALQSIMPARSVRPEDCIGRLVEQFNVCV